MDLSRRSLISKCCSVSDPPPLNGSFATKITVCSWNAWRICFVALWPLAQSVLRCLRKALIGLTVEWTWLSCYKGYTVWFPFFLAILCNPRGMNDQKRHSWFHSTSYRLHLIRMEISYKTHEVNLVFLEPTVPVEYLCGIWFTNSHLSCVSILLPSYVESLKKTLSLTEINESKVTQHETAVSFLWVSGNTWQTEDMKAETTGTVESVTSEALNAVTGKLYSLLSAILDVQGLHI